MKVTYEPDFPVTDAECKAATGKTFAEWGEEIEKSDLASKRRDAIHMIYNSTERKADVWWPTTVWVEYERAKGIVKKDGLAEGYNICATKTIKAPVEEVYKAWIDPAAMKDWYCGGYEGEVVEGGEMKDCDGNKAIFTRVRENKDLRMKWTSREGGETLVDVVFADKGGGKTLVTLTHQRIQDRPEADGLRRAWGEVFDRLKERLEK